MSFRAGFMLAVLVLALVFPALAADPTGKWSATFDTMIGQQKYTYDFKLVGDKLTGKATSQNGEAEIQDGKVTGDVITFVENINFQGNDIRIEYTGKISGDEIKFTRKVAEYATEELVAKREK
jgi:opacity protein-like surface antigen